MTRFVAMSAEQFKTMKESAATKEQATEQAQKNVKYYSDQTYLVVEVRYEVVAELTAKVDITIKDL